MNISSCIAIWVTSLAIMQGCHSSKNHQKENSREPANPDTTIMTNDSLQPPPPEPGLAPGQAKVRGKIVGIQPDPANQNYSIITFKVINVEAYGPSTPPIATQDTLKVGTIGLSAKKKEFSSGNIVRAILSYRQAMLGQTTSPRWSLVTLQ